MKALLEKADLFAHKINFNYGKKNMYHSFFGMGLTFSFYAVMIFFVEYFSRDFIYQKNPRVIYTETEFNDNVNISLPDIFKLGQIDINLKTNMIIDKFENTSSIPNQEFGFFYIQQIDRSRELPTKAQKNYYIINFNFPISVSVSKRDYDKGYLFRGNFDENSTAIHNSSILKLNETYLKISNRSHIYFGFVFNNNFYQYFNQKNISLGYMKIRCNIVSNIVNTNSESFFNTYFRTYDFIFDDSDGKGIIKFLKRNLNYGVVSVKDDKGLIISHPYHKKKLKENHDSTEISVLTSFTHLIEIEINPILKHYDRIYKKLQNVFSDLGGILSSLILIGNIIIVQFNKLKFDYDLINIIYVAERESDDPEIIKLNSKISRKEEILSKLNYRSPIHEINSFRIPINNSVKNHHFPKFKNIYSNQMDDEKLESPINYSRITAFSIKNKGKKYNTQNLEMTVNKSISCSLKPLENIFLEKEKNDLNRDIELISENFKKEKLFKKPLKYSKGDFFKTFLCCKKLKGEGLLEKEKLFSLAQDQIYEYMDIINYIQLNEKIDKFISIVLNESQALSFNYLRNKKISELKKDKFIEKESIIRVVNYFKNNIKDSKMSKIDERLLNNFYEFFSNLI